MKPNPPHFPHPVWVKAPPSPTSQFSFLLPSCHRVVTTAATVPRCIALLRPKSLTPMGRRSGWAKMHKRWFTPVPIAKSWLKATATAAANKDVKGSPPPHPPPPTHTTHHAVPDLSLWHLWKVTCPVWLAEWRCRWGKPTQEYLWRRVLHIFLKHIHHIDIFTCLDKKSLVISRNFFSALVFHNCCLYLTLKSDPYLINVFTT